MIKMLFANTLKVFFMFEKSYFYSMPKKHNVFMINLKSITEKINEEGSDWLKFRIIFWGVYYNVLTVKSIALYKIKLAWAEWNRFLNVSRSYIFLLLSACIFDSAKADFMPDFQWYLYQYNTITLKHQWNKIFILRLKLGKAVEVFI